MNFLVYRVGAFSHTEDQHTLHCLNAPHVDLHISWRVFGREGFYLIFKMFLYCFFQILCSVLFFKFSSGRQLAQRRTASAARGATYFMFFSNILVFQRKLLLLQFSIIWRRSFNKNTQFQKKPMTQNAFVENCFWKYSWWRNFFAKKSCSYCYQYQFIREGFQKSKVYSKGLDQYPYFSKYISISLENTYICFTA